MPVYKIGEVDIGVMDRSAYGDNLYYGVYYMNDQALRPDIVEVYQCDMTGGNIKRIAVYDEKDGKIVVKQH
ncbi:MAG TPA: hypothetical protein GX697_05420 [Firmicutes bacterium]|nr:hypothetical protein [Bacillota bacterium]